MLKKPNRLKIVKLKNPKVISANYFSIKVVKNNMNESRFAFVVSKKIDKRAVIRNSLKRKLRSCIEEVFDNIGGGWDFVFYPKASLLSTQRGQLLKELKDVFRKYGFIQK